jgi:hypothetical protein
MRRIIQLLLAISILALAWGMPLRARQGAPATETGSFLPGAASFNGLATRIPMRDGRPLAADLYLPKGGGKFPVVLIQTPYNKSLMRQWWTGAGRWGKNSLFTDANYAFVVTDWRGRFASQDALAAGATANLSQDGYDTVAWIAKQEWCNGRIGTWGPSALGRVQYETARAGPPNLVCAVPMVMPLNLDYDIYFPGGVLWEEFVQVLVRLGFGANIYNNLAARPVKNEAWKTIAATFVKGEDMRVPMLFVGGWFDIYTDSVIEAYQTVKTGGGEKARAHSKLIIGPWVHATDQERNGQLDFPHAALYSIGRARSFFDYWLRSVENGADAKEASITYYQMGLGEWRATDTWPPRGVRERAYYLHPERLLSTSAPGESAAPASFRYDPSNPAPTVGGHVLDQALSPGPQDQREKVESRQDVLVFSTPVLTQDLVVAGKVKVKLYVSSDRTDTDFTAILTDVYADGRSMLVSEGIRRMRFRHTTAKEELMKPGEVYPITIELTNTAITFLKGHRVRVIISSSNYPKYALNLNDGGPMYRKEKGAVATNQVYHDREHPSALVLPIAER